jgi:proteasome alpha subunit
VTMPFYVSPEQAMKDKADYARKAITRIRSGVVMTCDAGILFVAPNPSRALRKFSEIYDRIAFAAVGRYNEFENLRKAGVRYADMTGFQYDRQDVTARGLANWYAQLLGTIFTESPKPYEVEIVVAEVGKIQDDDQIYRITFDGSVADEHGFVVMGGQADQVAAVLKDEYSDGMTLSQAFTTAIQALAGPVKGAGEAGGGDQRNDITAAQLEVALLDRGRSHRTFRRLTGARLETLLGEAIPSKKTEAIAEGSGAAGQGADGAAGEADQGSGGQGQPGKGPGDSGGKAEPPGDATD